MAKEIQSTRPPNLGRLALKDLSPAIRTVVRDIQVGEISDPVKMSSGVLLLMACSREGGKSESKMPERDAIADRLMQERLSPMSRRYLRDIRLSAIIDIRV